MSGREKIEAVVLAAVLAGVGGSLAFRHGNSHARPLVDVDKKSDCWDRPDRLGHRHCDTRPAR